MSVEEKRSAEQIGTLGSCLIEGDSEQKSRERKTKRRALTLSIALQSLAIVALVVTPLLATPEKLPSTIIFVPMPPYHAMPAKPIVEHRPSIPQQRPTGFYQPTNIPPTISMRDKPIQSESGSDVAPDWNATVPVFVDGGTELFKGRKGPSVPDDPNRNQTRRVVKGGDVQQAMLIRRVDPSYPPIMRSLHRPGKVELKAIISVDGSIESLQVISGDPGFYQSALDAVRQWRYRPTALNGVPVEVETMITVVYTLNQ